MSIPVFHYDDSQQAGDPLVAAFEEGVTPGHIYLHDGSTVFAHVPVALVIVGDESMLVPVTP